MTGDAPATGVVNLVSGEPARAAIGGAPVVLTVLSAVVLLILGAVVWWRQRERMAQDPSGEAFERLARAMKMTKDERARVKEIAAYVPGAAPVSLLVSQAAMEQAMLAAELAGR